jgi:arylsulfatase A-like enzyme
LKENNPRLTGQPVFAFLSFYAVHSPIETTQEKWNKYRQKAEAMGIAPTGFKMGHFLPMRQVQDNPVYAGLVELMDDAVGVVLNSLKELGMDKNTVVIFTSDNGGVSAGDAFATSNLPLRGGKGYQFEGGIREPYFIKVPWITNSNKKCNTPVTGTDFYPTILDLADLRLKPDEHSDGVSLLPLLNGKKIVRRSLIWHYPHYGNQGGEPSSIIRKGDWKLIHYYEDDHEELYNLKKDSGETTDISKNNPALVQQMSTELFTYLKKVSAGFPSKDSEYSEMAEQKYLEDVLKNKLPQLEKQRMKFLSRDYDPGNNWWGSSVTKD